VVARQTDEDLEQRRCCPNCGNRYTAKGGGTITVKTLFGAVEVANPRWNRCSCQQSGPKTFRPAAAWLRGTTGPELLYMETKWASLIPFAKVADLLREVLPVDADDETIRRHVQATAERIEEALGEERQLNLFEGEQIEQEELDPPDGPITVGIDCGYVRAAHKEGGDRREFAEMMEDFGVSPAVIVAGIENALAATVIHEENEALVLAPEFMLLGERWFPNWRTEHRERFRRLVGAMGMLAALVRSTPGTSASSTGQSVLRTGKSRH
jgi:hypothetical protein